MYLGFVAWWCFISLLKYSLVTMYNHIYTTWPLSRTSSILLRYYFAGDNLKCITLNESICISFRISLKFVTKGPINKKPSVGSHNAMAPKRRQAIIWRIYSIYRPTAKLSRSLVGLRFSCRPCSNYIFILGLTPGFHGFGKREEKHLSLWIWCVLY